MSRQPTNSQHLIDALENTRAARSPLPEATFAFKVLAASFTFTNAIGR